MYVAQMLGCLENLKNGNTSLVENLAAAHPDDIAMEDATFRALRDSGIRGTLARAFEGRNFLPDFMESLDDQARRVTALAERWHGAEGDRLRLSFGPLLPWCMTEEMYRETRALADRLGLCLHMHVAESPEFNRLIAKHLGRDIRQVELLHETGCLGPDVQVVAVSDVSPGRWNCSPRATPVCCWTRPRGCSGAPVSRPSIRSWTPGSPAGWPPTGPPPTAARTCSKA
ncbi:amidohydrolase family protein [Alcanivorax sp. IO_7]|nr:amidohydrolase family protein [Alcanivorax sp. IO_7]